MRYTPEHRTGYCSWKLLFIPLGLAILAAATEPEKPPQKCERQVTWPYDPCPKPESASPSHKE